MKVFKMFVAATAVVLLASVSARASEMDSRIESSANQSYVYKTYLKNDAIKTESKNGVVTLTGSVSEAYHKTLAQETVSSLPGVTSVNNQLVYKGDLPAEKSDAWLSVQVKTSLLYNRNVSGVKTQVFVTDGIVTLKGEADNQAQKDLAGEYAKDVDGVKAVSNEMTIAAVAPKSDKTMGEKIDDASITAQVRMAFLSHHSTSAFKTGVDTKDGVVTLTGMASNGAGKDMAAKVASDVHGVTKVINNMTIGDSLTKK